MLQIKIRKNKFGFGGICLKVNFLSSKNHQAKHTINLLHKLDYYSNFIRLCNFNVTGCSSSGR